MTARTLAAERREGKAPRDITQKNIDKVTRYREHGVEELEQLASRFEQEIDPDEEELAVKVPQKKVVYPIARHLRDKPKKAKWTRN
jgi:large subunit ribosomal protein L17